ncbi:hypothetical protein ACF0H5_002562 [Mactra antiquata]
MSNEYITEVAVPAIVVDTNNLNLNGISETDLIKSISLASSEKEINPLKKSTSSSLADEKQTSLSSDKICNAMATGKEDGETEQNVESLNTAKTDEDDSVFCETPIDESSLIANVKLADDGVHGGYESTSSLKQSEKGNTTTISLQHGEFITVADVSTCTNGSMAPRNSIIDVLLESTGENISESDRTQMVRLDEEVHGSVVTDDMSNDRDFCKLMNDVLTELQDCDVEEIIRIFVGSGIVEEGHLTGYVSSEQVIARLRKYRFISRDNLHHLQNIIMRLDDSVLYFQCVQYLKHHHDIVFFYQELEDTPKGFGIVRCYIGGRDFTRLTREDVELTRYKVASMVFLPAQFFYIVGIEPGQRVVLSLMVLERYVDELYSLAKDGLPELNLIGVEAIQIYNKTFSTAGRAAVDIYWGNRSSSYASVYRQLREKSERVEEQDREIKDLREELEFLQLEVDTVGAEIDVLANPRGTLLTAGRRSRSRSSDNRSRARSMPPREKVRDDGRHRYLAITSGPEVDLNEKFIAMQKAAAERRRRLSDDRRELSLLERRLRYSPRSPRTSSEFLFRSRFDDRDHLMNEIQTIIDEITFAQSAN